MDPEKWKNCGKIENEQIFVAFAYYLWTLWTVSSFQNRRIVKRYSFYIRLKLSQSRTMLIFHTPWKHQKRRFSMFPGCVKGNIDPKCVTQLQYRRERHILMLLAWNASSSIVEQNDCKSKTTWLTKTFLSKSCSSFHITYTKDIENAINPLQLFVEKCQFFNQNNQWLNKIIFH